MVNLSDVAKAAGVTKMTVSNVVNGKSGRVSAATRERVLAVVAELGYQPNASASALSTARSDIVALVILGSREGESPLANPHYASLLGEIVRGIAKRGKQLMVHFSVDVATTVATMRSWNVDGAVIFGAFATEILRLDAAHSTPQVFIDAYVDRPVTVCRLNDELGGYLAARTLVRAGHERIGFVGPITSERPNVVSQRHAGYRRALAEAGIDAADTTPLVGEADFHAARRLAPMLLEDPRDFTGFVTTADVLAAGLIKGFGDVGVRVPHDISVVGFDDTALAEMLSPALTTVHQDVAAKANGALTLLFEQIDGSEARLVVVNPWIVERESVAPPFAAPSAPLH